jgi:hypothetical protein
LGATTTGAGGGAGVTGTTTGAGLTVIAIRRSSEIKP